MASGIWIWREFREKKDFAWPKIELLGRAYAIYRHDLKPMRVLWKANYFNELGIDPCTIPLNHNKGWTDGAV